MPKVGGKKFPYTAKGKKAAKKAKKKMFSDQKYEKTRKQYFGLK